MYRFALNFSPFPLRRYSSVCAFALAAALAAPVAAQGAAPLAAQYVATNPASLSTQAADQSLSQASTNAATQATTVGWEISKLPDGREITVFFPSVSPEKKRTLGRFTLSLADRPQLTPGAHPLLVLSHGSGGSAVTYADLAREFVKAGYLVVVPEHEGDNYRNHSKVGPPSWERRPAEASEAIDWMTRHPVYGAALKQDARGPLTGVYGMSAGGVTALTMAGGVWSHARFRDHCLANMAQDFGTCVGLSTQLTGSAADSLRIGIAKTVHRSRFSDETPRRHQDSRVRAVVAAVPMAAPFHMESLAKPTVPVGLWIAGQDTWLVPRFHAEAVVKACASCRVVINDATAGHGSSLSPWPQELAASITPMLVDPPEFRRDTLPGQYARIVAFFAEHLK
jgi:predicted dienelactone hydrolase